MPGGTEKVSTGSQAYTITPARVFSCQATRLNRSARIGRWRLGKYTSVMSPSPLG
ncbi:Uncharacterised protein [Bordetella pertussis]|nr:Uncharacterised protein [Bordetella pertussis]CFP59037.1 Uncharacterised protein [Bordetella pertussis]CFW32796.1 Uncharacterised protein [Bordetella pertussis]